MFGNYSNLKLVDDRDHSFTTVSVSTDDGHITAVEMDTTTNLKENVSVIDG